MDEAVIKAMEPYFMGKFYNPAANYLSAKSVKDEITEAKKSVAAQLGAKHTEIICTSGGTEANNLAISGVMDKFPRKKVLASNIEHESVLKPAEKYDHSLIPVDKRGAIKLESLKKLITNDVVLISVILASNETGAAQPIRKIAELIKQVRKSRRANGIGLPLYLHSDACQTPCYMDINTNRLGVDLLTLNGGKIYGPKGSGVLFAKTGVEPKPQILGGGQQQNRRSGTENPAAAAGFAKALEIASGKRKDEAARLEKLRAQFVEGLFKTNPKIVINGHPKQCAPHILSVTFPGADNERLLYQLEEKGILAAAGSACSAASDEPSHVLRAMGISDTDARSSLRFSFGRATTSADIKHLLEILGNLIA